MKYLNDRKAIRRTITIAVALFFIGILCLWLRRELHVSRSGDGPLSSASSAHTAISSQVSPAWTPVDAIQKPGGPYVSSDPRWRVVREKDKVDKGWEWKMPINFYGRVIDENGSPVPGARVVFLWTNLFAEGSSQSMAESDATGVFSLEDKIGRVLQVDVSKQGYYKPRNERLRSFDYAAFWEVNYHEPDPARPVTFHLRKKGRVTPLIVGEKQRPIAANGTPSRLDLLHDGRVSSAGQFEIAALTNTEKYPPAKFDWRATITIHDGGLTEHELEFPFEAPVEGYQPTFAFAMPSASPDWKREIEKKYFIRFGNPPTYGRVVIRLNGASQKVYLRYAINPTGSRDLEHPTEEEFSEP